MYRCGTGLFWLGFPLLQDLSEILEKSGVQCVQGCLFLQCLPFPCSPCLWGSPMLWGPIQLACNSSACSFSPALVPFFLLTSAELEGCRLWGPVHAPQEYQKAGNLHFNNSLIMYLSDPVNILHFLNFADCRHCGLSSQ